MLFGVVPALRATDLRLAEGLQEASRAATTARQRNPLAGMLVIAQVALSMLLVTAAALLVFSLRSLERIDPGFDAESVLVFRLDPRQNGYEGPRARALVESVLERVRRIPGVRAASFSSHPLIAGAADVTAARPAGTSAPASGTAEAQAFIAEHRAWRLVTDDEFLATMGIRLRSGRHLSHSDTDTAPLVAVVNEPELGLRLALGAGRGTVKWMVLKQSIVLVGVGLAIGVPAAVASSRFVSSLLFGVSPTSPLAIGVSSAIMLAVSLLASFVPAHRASRVDPMVALRAE